MKQKRNWRKWAYSIFGLIATILAFVLGAIILPIFIITWTRKKYLKSQKQYLDIQLAKKELNNSIGENNDSE